MKTPANLASRRHPDRLTTRAHQHGRRLNRRARRFIKTGHPRGCSERATRCLSCSHRLMVAKAAKTERRNESRLRRLPIWHPSVRR